MLAIKREVNVIQVIRGRWNILNELHVTEFIRLVTLIDIDIVNMIKSFVGQIFDSTKEYLMGHGHDFGQFF